MQAVLELRQCSPPKLAKSPKKRHHHKVRTGCLTCKQRRVKCDEGFPHCYVCTKSGRTCGGYNIPTTWIFPPAQKEKIAQLSTIATISSGGFNHDPVTQRSLQFFCEQTAPLISFYFEEMIMQTLDSWADVEVAIAKGRSFWMTIVPQMSHAQDAVKQSIVALSSLHEGLEFSPEKIWSTSSFGVLYLRAIQLIKKDLHILPVESILISCIILANSEFMQSAVILGRDHLAAGLRILDEWRHSQPRGKFGARQNATTSMIEENISPIFEYYLEKASQIIEQADHSDENGIDLIQNIKLPHLHVPFRDLRSAHSGLDGIVQYIFNLTKSQQLSVSPVTVFEVQKLVRKLLNGVAEYQRSLPGPKIRELKFKINLLEIHSQLVMIMVAYMASGSEFIFDNYTTAFRIILMKMREILQAGLNSEPTTRPGNGDAILSLGYITPLIFSAIKCREPFIQRDALEMLQKLGVVEGSLDNCHAYRIAKTMTDLEIEDSADSVELFYPSTKSRFRFVRAMTFEDGSTLLEYSRSPSSEGNPLIDQLVLSPRPYDPGHAVLKGPLTITTFGYCEGFLRPILRRCNCYQGTV